MRRVSKKANLSHKTTCSPVLEQFQSHVCLDSKNKIISQVKWHYTCWFLPSVSPPPLLSSSFYFLSSYLLICRSFYFLSIHFVKVRDLSHENLNPFIGACIESPNILLVWSYCKKGSLQVCTCL